MCSTTWANISSSICWKASSFSTGASRSLCKPTFNSYLLTKTHTCLNHFICRLTFCKFLRFASTNLDFKSTDLVKNPVVKQMGTSMCFPSIMHLIVKLRSCGNPEEAKKIKVIVISSVTFFMTEVICWWGPAPRHAELLWWKFQVIFAHIRAKLNLQ